MRSLVLISLLAMAGCAASEPPADRLPVQAARCPDPANRDRLGQGSTFRDLARAKAEALTGWEECFTAARENADAIERQTDE